jgi:DNA-directed RNA polymerase subunit RPC12/RpoP
VVIARFIQPWRADLTVSLLESEGVQSFLVDDHLARTEPVSSILAGGIRLLVRDEDASRASEILRRAESGEMSLQPWDGDPAGSPLPERVADAGEVRCPRCGSAHVAKRSGLAGFLKPGYGCRVCGRKFST